MRWLAVAVLIGGWAWAGWRNAPPVVHADSGVFVVAVVASLAAAYWFGRRGGRASAVAVATARAEARAAAAAQSVAHATNQVVLNVAVPGAREVASASLGGLDAAPWIGPPRALLEQEVGEMYAEELLDGQEVGEYEVG